jgi:phosphate transport system substrate-binding protein
MMACEAFYKMKRTVIPILLIILILLSSCGTEGKNNKTISISGAWALYPMVVKWSEEYHKINPEVRIDISAGGAGKGITDALNGLVDIGMVSREINPDEMKNGASPVAVAKDAVVAIVNEHNPSLAKILATGLTRDAGYNIWITGEYNTWDRAFNDGAAASIHVYTRSDACGAAEIWAMFFDKKQEDLLGVGVYGDPGLAQAVKTDSLGIGFNNIGYVYDNINKLRIAGLRVVPIDLNNNGKIDNDENFYDSMTDLIIAITSGKYPSPPARELYFVLKGKPVNKKVLREFITWVLTDGQKYVNEAGYVSLPESTIDSGLKKLQ